MVVQKKKTDLTGQKIPIFNYSLKKLACVISPLIICFFLCLKKSLRDILMFLNIYNEKKKLYIIISFNQILILLLNKNIFRSYS